MNLSRRGFLAGALGALGSRILAPAGKLTGPRYWLAVETHGWYDVPDDDLNLLVLQFIARRNDGQAFYTVALIRPGEREGADLLPLATAKKLQARMQLDSFLDPRCECRRDFYCEFHACLAPGICVEVEDGEKSLSEPAVA